MRAVALPALVFGFMGTRLLDGQVFTHAVEGIMCGLVSFVCGVALARKGRDPRWTSWMIAALGLGLAIWCGIKSPAAYRSQQKFNDRSREHREKIQGQDQLTQELLRAAMDNGDCNRRIFGLAFPAGTVTTIITA
jgi:hypothetical protein